MDPYSEVFFNNLIKFSNIVRSFKTFVLIPITFFHLNSKQLYQPIKQTNNYSWLVLLWCLPTCFCELFGFFANVSILIIVLRLKWRPWGQWINNQQVFVFSFQAATVVQGSFWNFKISFFGSLWLSFCLVVRCMQPH